MKVQLLKREQEILKMEAMEKVYADSVCTARSITKERKEDARVDLECRGEK